MPGRVLHSGWCPSSCAVPFLSPSQDLSASTCGPHLASLCIQPQICSDGRHCVQSAVYSLQSTLTYLLTLFHFVIVAARNSDVRLWPYNGQYSSPFVRLLSYVLKVQKKPSHRHMGKRETRRTTMCDSSDKLRNPSAETEITL